MADQPRRRGEIARLLEGGYWLQVGDERRRVSAEEVAATTIATPPKRKKVKAPKPAKTRRVVRIGGTVTSGAAQVVKVGEPDFDKGGRAKVERVGKRQRDPKPGRA